MAITAIPLVKAAQTIATDPSSLRRALNRFGIVDRHARVLIAELA
jgi:hypothetical protein